MKKILLLIMCLYAGASAYAQMATTTEAGNDGESRLISNDERKIHFGSVAKKLYADLNPTTHAQNGGLDMSVHPSGDYAGYHDENNTLQEASCTYSYNNGVGTFSYRNVFWGNAAVNLLDKLEGKLGDYENFVIRTLSVTSPREGQNVAIRVGGAEPQNYPQSARYAVQFCDKNNAVIREAIIYSNDVKVIHLKEFFTPQQIQEINSVFISTCGANTFLDADVQIAEAYFISAYNMNDENYFKDMDGNYIGNAYIHPSYFICSNNVTLDEATGVITVGEPGAQSYQSANLDASMFKSWDGVDANATSTGNPECLNTIGTSAGNVYGDANVYYLNYADLSDYDRLTIVTGSENEIPRLLFNRQTNEGALLEVNLADSRFTNYVTKDNNKFVIDLAAIKEAQGYVHLNAIKGANWSNITVSSMIVEKLNALNKPASLQLSVPFEGFDMRDITVVTFDNEEDGDVIWRNIYGNKNYDKLGHVRKGADKRTQAEGSREHEIDLANENEDCHDVRTLYTSRYNADFQNDQMNQGYADKINNIYWETNYIGSTNPIGTMTVNDICFTKNHVVVRNGGNHTLLSKSLFNADVTEQLGVDLSGDSNFFLGDVVGSKYADLSKYYKMQIKGTPGKEIVIVANIPEDKAAWDGIYHETYVRLDSKGLANVDIAEIVANEGAYRLNFVSTPRGNTETIKLDYIKLYADEDGIVELNEDLFHTWNRAENGTVTRLEAYGGAVHGNSNHHLVNKIGTEETLNSGNVIFGNDGSKFYKEDYAELTGYKKIKVTGTPGLSIRIVYNVSQNETESQPCIYKDWTQPIGDNGTVEMDIREFVYFHLNGIKVGWGASTGTVSKVELISDERVDYVLEGNGTLSKTDDDAKAYANGGKNGNIGTNAMAALNDVGARVFDARPRVSISRTSIAYPANPNSLIIMRKNLSRGQSGRVQFDTPSKDGVAANMLTFDGLTSDDYKITQAKVDNLQLFDGFPFSAPRDFTVGTAKLTRKTTANVVGTLILPFACNELNGTAYKTFGSEYAEYDTEKQGILSNVDINKGDHVLKFEATNSAVAYQPYLYVASATNDNTEFVSASTEIAKTPETYDEQIELMTNNSAITSDEAIDQDDLHYLRGFMESTHVENVYAYTAAGKLIAATNATMNPFRVLIQAPKNISEDRQAQATSAPVKVVLASVFDDADVTAIESVETLDPERNVDVFSVNGALVKKNVKAADALQSLPKGVYVVGGKKIVK